MSVKVPKAKIRLKNKTAYSVRASQAVLQYGVGAMVDFRDRTLMTAAPEYWSGSVSHIRDERLEKILHVDYFGKPGDKDDVKFAEGISYVRFPEWYFCPSCRRFKPIGEWVTEYRAKSPKKAEEDPHMIQTMKCPKCFQELVVARIITACQEGHIDDFPWVKWVHCQNFGGPKEICSRPELTITTSSSASEGLEGLTLKCLNCGAAASLRGAFDPGKFEELDKKTDFRYNFRCAGKHPWKHKTESCKSTEYPKVLQRGSSSVYFPVTESSLVIPPYSSIVTNKIDESAAYAEYKAVIASYLSTPGITAETIELLHNSQTQVYAQRIAQETAIPFDKVVGVLKRKNAAPDDGEYSTASVKYRAEEYEAITGETVIEAEDYGEFYREGVDISAYNLPFLKSISLIHKVREVQALVGFTRLKPVDSTDAPGSQAVVVPVKEPDTKWYPAYDVRGEGTVYIGIGYAQSEKKGICIGCSQLFDSTGTGVRMILRKISNPLYAGKRNPYMDKDEARKMMTTLREKYYRCCPTSKIRRVVIHKTTPFMKDEIIGITQAFEGVDVELIQIQEYSSWRGVRFGDYAQADAYSFALQRGTVVSLNEESFLLWTHGCVMSDELAGRNRNYYKSGRGIPSPVLVKRFYGQADADVLAKEILMLTKMNWNSGDSLYKILPVTLDFAKVLSRMSKQDEAIYDKPYDFRYFM